MFIGTRLGKWVCVYINDKGKRSVLRTNPVCMSLWSEYTTCWKPIMARFRLFKRETLLSPSPIIAIVCICLFIFSFRNGHLTPTETNSTQSSKGEMLFLNYLKYPVSRPISLYSETQSQLEDDFHTWQLWSWMILASMYSKCHWTLGRTLRACPGEHAHSFPWGQRAAGHSCATAPCAHETLWCMANCPG